MNTTMSPQDKIRARILREVLPTDTDPNEPILRAVAKCRQELRTMPGATDKTERGMEACYAAVGAALIVEGMCRVARA